METSFPQALMRFPHRNTHVTALTPVQRRHETQAATTGPTMRKPGVPDFRGKGFLGPYEQPYGP